MTKDEARAVAFVGILLLLAVAARIINRPKPVTIVASPVNLEALREAGRSLAKPTPPHPKERTTPRPAPKALGPLNLNRATAAELEELPGIGPALAARIISRRDSLGGFRELGDLDAVKGIGPALLAKLQPLLVVR